MECPTCSKLAVKKGFRYNHNSKKQKYYCKFCETYFVKGLTTRHDPEIIQEVVIKKKEGLSLEKIRKFLKQSYSVDVARSTLYFWWNKYSSY